MDFLRTRTLAYLIGAVEFADNIRLNVLDALITFEPRGASSWKNLEGKTCIITGGNAGIGLATAAAVAKHGGRVVLACRSLERGNKAAKVISGKTCDGKSEKLHEVEVRELDLGSLESVRSFAKAFNSEHKQLDLLICNAGQLFGPLLAGA
ncbi:probable retinol dehydrogenase 11 [Coccomyxa sp. Obi]|nr:probable retinol dehydrogenase 11 [Coccomyxa sp. Obi]